jgi:hypothetical protein
VRQNLPSSVSGDSNALSDYRQSLKSVGLCVRSGRKGKPLAGCQQRGSGVDGHRELSWELAQLLTAVENGGTRRLAGWDPEQLHFGKPPGIRVDSQRCGRYCSHRRPGADGIPVSASVGRLLVRAFCFEQEAGTPARRDLDRVGILSGRRCPYPRAINERGVRAIGGRRLKQLRPAETRQRGL